MQRAKAALATLARHCRTIVAHAKSQGSERFTAAKEFIQREVKETGQSKLHEATCCVYCARAVAALGPPSSAVGPSAGVPESAPPGLHNLHIGL